MLDDGDPDLQLDERGVRIFMMDLREPDRASAVHSSPAEAAPPRD